MMNHVNYNLVNVVENKSIDYGFYPKDKMTFDEFIDKIKNHESINQGTTIYFNMHDIISDDSSNYLSDEFTHIPTNTKIIVEYDEEMESWSRTSILIPGFSEKIWIGDDEEDCWWHAAHEQDTCGFELKVFVEWY